MRNPVPALHQGPSARRVPAYRVAAIAVSFAAIALTAALLFPSRIQPDSILLASGAIVLGALAWLHARSLQLSRDRFLHASHTLEQRDQEFQSVLERAFDAILILDDQLICREANPAAAQLLGIDQKRLVGRSVGELASDPTEGSRLRSHLLGDNSHCERLQLSRADGARILADFSSSAIKLPGCHLLMLRDATALVRAEQARNRSMSAAQSSFIEAEVLRNATIALTRSAPLDPVLDDLFEILHSVIPYETGHVLLFEAPGQLFSAREISWTTQERSGPKLTLMFDTGQFGLLRQTLGERQGVLIRDLGKSGVRQSLPKEIAARAWIGVPLYAGEEKLGILSLTHSSPASFTSGNLRVAATLAVHVALAVHHSRVRERSEIYLAELEQHFS